MKVLFVHNFYQIAGGEDAVLKQEMDLLSADHDVLEYTVSNDNISCFFSKVLTLLRVPFSLKSYRQFKQFLTVNKPDVVHVHNYFPLLSPSIFYACKKLNIPVVHTLHNYRAVCPTALLMHKGKINEQSITHNVWWTVRQKVYKDSLLGSFALACMVQLHKRLGTWKSKVDVFIALTEFAKAKYVEAGWPKHKIIVKPNFIIDPFDGAKSITKTGGYALFVGRLSEEKGIDVLLNAWANINLPLKLIGTGPFKGVLKNNTQNNIEYLGLKDKPEVLELIKNADFVVMPSTWYEGLPMVLIESFCCGTPALVSNIGSMQEVVTAEVSGLHFEVGNSSDLQNKVQWIINNPAEIKRFGCNARNEFLNKYTSDINKYQLLNIYQQAINGVS
ncbi:glycosyltransferase family 4 protein [Pseudoalteromonas distincta]|uniref:Glycosyltransferase family 4 protein n=1 Tax=Pseudoalteromonas distincta TaxID=77608 RepID=A0A4P9J0I3_9GAMM|nr:glycosyltransferase family 4 protein [Pseudoalteromonas distincta]QCU73928.1 glycosyltransferase family 4 protein [Pseudoalteromonas distincta]